MIKYLKRTFKLRPRANKLSFVPVLQVFSCKKLFLALVRFLEIVTLNLQAKKQDEIRCSTDWRAISNRKYFNLL